MGERLNFQVRWNGKKWVVQRENATWDGWPGEPLKESATRLAFQLAAAFNPSDVAIQRKSGPTEQNDLRVVDATPTSWFVRA